MFSKLSVAVASALFVFAAASPQYYGTTYPECGMASSVTGVASSVVVPPVSSATGVASSMVPPVSSVAAITSIGTVTSTAATTTTTTTSTSSASGTSNQCCTSVQSSDNNAVSAIAGLLGLNLSGLGVPIGLGCSPLTILGNNCGGTKVSCDAPQQEWGSLIAINCLEITL